MSTLYCSDGQKVRRPQGATARCETAGSCGPPPGEGSAETAGAAGSAAAGAAAGEAGQAAAGAAAAGAAAAKKGK